MIAHITNMPHLHLLDLIVVAIMMLATTTAVKLWPRRLNGRKFVPAARRAALKDYIAILGRKSRRSK